MTIATTLNGPLGTTRLIFFLLEPRAVLCIYFCCQKFVWNRPRSFPFFKFNAKNLFQIYVTDTSSPCTAGQLLLDGKHLVCVYGNGMVLLWNLKDSTNSSVNLDSPCTTLDLHPSLPLIAVGTENGLTSLINTTNMNVVSRLGRTNEVSFLRFLLEFYPLL